MITKIIITKDKKSNENVTLKKNNCTATLPIWIIKALNCRSGGETIPKDLNIEK